MTDFGGRGSRRTFAKKLLAEARLQSEQAAAGVPVGIADGDYGDVTVSGGGTTITIDAGAVSTTKLGGDITAAGKALLDDANNTAQRITLGLGSAATQAAAAFDAAGTASGAVSAHAALTTGVHGITAYGADLVDSADAAAARSTLALGTLATQSGTFSGTSSGTNTGDQTSVSGNAGTATALTTGRTIGITGAITYTSPAFDGTGNVTASSTLNTTLDAVPTPVASVNFADQQALSFRIENRTSDPGTPSTGQIWLRTDL